MKTPSWLTDALTHPHMTDLCLNGHETAFVDQGQGMEFLPCSWNEEEMRAWTLYQISSTGKSWDAKYPFIDATLPSGHRMHVAFPPLAQKGILVSLRRLPYLQNHGQRDTHSHRQEMSQRWNHSPFLQLLLQAVEKGESILISGATGSGKTTLMNDLLSMTPCQERIIALEDTPELHPTHPHFLTLLSRPPNADGFGEVTLRTLLKQALRMRPDRIVLGECRGAEVLELLQALNTGHRGAMATLHANSPRDVLRRIELLCLLASGGVIPLLVIRELLSIGLQWIVQVHRVEKVRTMTELWKIEGREGDIILLRQMIQSNNEPNQLTPLIRPRNIPHSISL